jgi:hypothetical protein
MTTNENNEWRFVHFDTFGRPIYDNGTTLTSILPGGVVPPELPAKTEVEKGRFAESDEIKSLVKRLRKSAWGEEPLNSPNAVLLSEAVYVIEKLRGIILSNDQDHTRET